MLVWLLPWLLFGAVTFLLIGGFKRWRLGHLVILLIAGPILFLCGAVKAWHRARRELRSERNRRDNP